MKRLGIEDFAAWAVLHEWPKMEGRSDADLDAARAAALAFIVRQTGRGLSPPTMAAMSWSDMIGGGAIGARRPRGSPHPDAVAFRRACEALGASATICGYDLDWLLSDQDIAPRADERLERDWRAGACLAEMSVDPVSLVVAYAASPPEKGRGFAAPDWHPEPIARRWVSVGGRARWFVTRGARLAVRDRGGRVVGYKTVDHEDDGYDLRRRRPKPGAWRKLVLDPDPGFVARDRHVYGVWWSALAFLASWLRDHGGLCDHQVEPPQGVENPWQSAVSRRA